MTLHFIKFHKNVLTTSKHKLGLWRTQHTNSNSNSRICSAPPYSLPEGALNSQCAVRKRLQMAPECCCWRPWVSVLSVEVIPCMRCSDREFTVTNSPLVSWLEEVVYYFIPYSDLFSYCYFNTYYCEVNLIFVKVVIQNINCCRSTSMEEAATSRKGCMEQTKSGV